jgi:hypothetical protein
MRERISLRMKWQRKDEDEKLKKSVAAEKKKNRRSPVM